MDDAVAELVDDPGPDGELMGQRRDDIGGEEEASSSAETIATTPTPGSDEESKASKEKSSSKSKSKWFKSSSTQNTPSSKQMKPSKNVPQLKPSQRRMIRSLNAEVKQLKKYAAYIHPIRNAHGTIISRDVKNYDFHRRGEGVLLHWADTFVF